MVSKPWAVAVVAAGAAAVVGRSAWIGGRLQEQMEAAATRLPAEVPVVRLIGKTYERGLFSSTQTVSFEFGCPAVAAPAAGASAPVRVAAVQLTARHRIQHGPFPGFRSVGAATIDSHLVAPEASRKRVAELFGDKAPVSAHTRVALSGAYDSRVTVPAFSHKLPTGGQLAWQGLQSDVSASGWGPGAKLRYEMILPGLTLSSKDERTGVDMDVKLSGMKAKGDFVVGPSFWLSAGHSESESRR